MPGGKIAMTQANLRLVEGTFMGKTKAVDAALSQFEWAVGKARSRGSGKTRARGSQVIEAIEPEAKLFVIAEQVDLAEKAFHDTLVHRNEAQIAFLREPSIMAREAFEAAKTDEATELAMLTTEGR